VSKIPTKYAPSSEVLYATIDFITDDNFATLRFVFPLFGSIKLILLESNKKSFSFSFLCNNNEHEWTFRIN
jgi:hypothetical protein